MISANIICKNEENNIEQCLNSIKDIVDEIIIIDTGSTDKTLEIISKFDKVKLFKREWTDFSDLRNQAKNLSKGDYILVIDADMTFQGEIKLNDSDYYLGQISMDSEIGRLDFPYIVLFKNLPQIEWYGKRHATIEKSIKGLKGSMIDVTLLHPQISKEELTEKMKRNLEIHLWQLDNEDNDVVPYHLQRTYYYLQDYDNAIKYGLETLKRPLNRQTKAVACNLLGLSYYAKSDNANFVKSIENSLGYVPKQVFARLMMFKILCPLNPKMAEDELNTIQYLSQNKISDLPADYFYTLNEIENLKGEIKWQ